MVLIDNRPHMCYSSNVPVTRSAAGLRAYILCAKEVIHSGKAIITVVIGWVVVFIVGALVATVLGVGAVGLGALTGSLQ